MDERPGQMQIGRVLTAARERAGLDLRDAEAQTKIRIRYLEALEHEDWAELPSTAYAKGFLRTYGELLGLDGETLVDEYRRQVEPDDPGGRGYPLADPSRGGPAGSAGGQPRRWWLLAVVVGVAAAAVIAVLVLSGDDGDDRREPPRKKQDNPTEQRDRKPRRAADGSVELSLVVRAPVEVCLIGGGGSALIDGQVLAPGTRERYRRDEFELGFPAGFDPKGLQVEIGGQRRALPAVDGPAAFRIRPPARLSPTEPRAVEDCP